MKKRLEYIIKHNTFIQRIYTLVFSSLFRFFGLFMKTNENLVLFCSYGGKKFNDSPKVLYEYMINHSHFSKYKFVWAFEEPDNFDLQKGAKIKIDSWEYFKTALKAKYWITNVNIERGLKFKKRNTIYLNTWHGTALKVIGNGVNSRNDYDFSNVDILCCDGDYLKDIFIKDFNALEKNIIFSGRPREDYLFNYNETDVKKFKKKLNIPLEKRVILYTPTWRESSLSGRKNDISNLFDINKWKSKLHNEFVVLFRAHHLSKGLTEIKNDDFIRDVSDYPDINHLYIVSDILISDYSSTFFDFALLDKPIICFAKDYEEYVNTRGLYIDLENEFLSDVLKNDDDVIEKIINLDYSEECRKVVKFREKFINRPENATELCVEALINKSKSEKNNHMNNIFDLKSLSMI